MQLPRGRRAGGPEGESPEVHGDGVAMSKQLRPPS